MPGALGVAPPVVRGTYFACAEYANNKGYSWGVNLNAGVVGVNTGAWGHSSAGSAADFLLPPFPAS